MAFKDTISVFWDKIHRPLATLDRCMINRGAYAFKIVWGGGGGTLKWLLKGGSRLIGGRNSRFDCNYNFTLFFILIWTNVSHAIYNEVLPAMTQLSFIGIHQI